MTQLNFPNFLTLSHFALAGVFMFFLFNGDVGFKIAALAVFMLACLTDYWDGVYARKHQEITVLGQLLDPIADKVLNFSAFLSFVDMDILPAWMVLVMLTREIFVTLFRFLGASRGEAMPADKSGKVKTVLQVGVIVAILAAIVWTETPYWNAAWGENALMVIQTAVFLVLVFTVWSGTAYVQKHWKQVSGQVSR